MKNTFELSKNLYRLEKNTTRYDSNCVEPRIPVILKWIGSGKKVLDVGCYDGFYSKMIADLGNEVYGMEANSDAVKKALEKGIKVKEADLESKFPFKSGNFDIVYAGEVIEHLYDTDAFVNECLRVLKKGGLFIITTPNTVSLPRRALYLIGKGRFFEASNTFSAEEFSVGHIRFFTKDLLRDFIQSFGFELLEFTSDYVNLPFLRSKLFAKIKPTFGRSLIMKFKKVI